MSTNQQIRCYDYVNHPYAAVRDALEKDAVGVFHAATKSASSRAGEVASELRVDIGGLSIGTDIDVTVNTIEHTSQGTRIPIEWKASRAASLFPVMSGALSIYPITSTETQLDFQGSYEPPMGALGKALDTLAGHRIADAAVHRFLTGVASYLRDAVR